MMKKILFTILLVILIIYSCFFPQITLEASKTGITIWFQQILPALLPFTILSGVLIRSNFLHSFSGNANIIAVLLTTVCGFIFGFPIGAKLSADFYRSGLLSEKQALMLAVLANNFSPMYVCGYVLPTLFETDRYQKITYVLIYFIPLTLLSLISLGHYINVHNSTHQREKHNAASSDEQSARNDKSTSAFHLNMEIMDTGIISGFESLIRICGYIVLFSIVAEILNRIWSSPPFLWNWLLGNLEITNGIHLLSQSSVAETTKYAAAVQLLSFGGLSGIAQTASIFGTDNAKGLSVYKYIIGKVILSLLLTLLSVTYVSYFNSY